MSIETFIATPLDQRREKSRWANTAHGETSAWSV